MCYCVLDGNVVIIVEDVIVCCQIEQYIWYFVWYDVLIGLLNCYELYVVFKWMFVCWLWLLSLVFVIMYFDFDGFKLINDCFGYQVGDEVFMQVVEWFGKMLLLGEFVVCIGGDEFVVVIDDMMMYVCLIFVVWIIWQILVLYGLLNGEIVCIGISIGIVFDDGYGLFDELIW